ncbi:alpha-2-macroglobulin, partial [bacterium]|nr:alpha-2-macroglobulin [bacterium]
MKYMKFFLLVVGLFLVSSAAFVDGVSYKQQREKFDQIYKQGNYKEAYEGFRKLALSPNNDPGQVGSDLYVSVSCLQRLGRVDEIDELREAVIEVHKDNWRLLFAAAKSYFDTASHYGYIVAGEFHRGGHRGAGRYVNSFERDRVRALQLMDQALKHTQDEEDKYALSSFYLEFARMLMGYRGYEEAWRLQYLSDLSELPDYEEGYGHYGQTTKGAPVAVDGTPIFHNLPKSYQKATRDGERWRWMLMQAVELDSGKTKQVLKEQADFLHQQFGVRTIGSYGRYFTDEAGDKGGAYQAHTLAEDETIARLATGIRRFQLPDEFNFIKIYQKIEAFDELAQIFENRRQYTKAADYWKRSIERYGRSDWKQKRLDQILGNWGQFEPVMTHPAGKGATVEYRFRNGKKVSFEAHKIQVETLLADVKSYLKSNPRKLDWDKLNIGNIGYRLVQRDEKKYIGQKVAKWALDLEPRKMRLDKRITVTTPLQKAGAYLLTARMANGNTSKIIIWVNDTVIVKKQLDKKAYFFVADAVTGRPLPKVSLEFFGYRQEYVKWEKIIGRHHNVLTTNFAEFTDEDGQVIPGPKDLETNYQWIITATTMDGRLAYLGFTGVWYSGYRDSEYDRTKTFVITDRPVYRPNQPVKFKFWVRHAKYDQEDKSAFANEDLTVQINNPKGEKVFETQFRTDDYGGLDGEWLLPRDAALGVYRLSIPGYGGGSFRVEEYKKPEFEVEIAAPDEPVMLGEKITATIKAKYYFGAPVTKATVKYKVLRSNYSANWYPAGSWDWFYDPGYWWFGYDYEWYPGWRLWGCERPHRWWWPTSRTPPEVVAEAEVKIADDGTVKVEIDTSFAKEMHPDIDHRYEITAEVTDESRRTIIAKGTVLVSRKPFKVYAWVDRGHYRAGDVVQADFSAQTLDKRPVKGKGELKLLRITYDKDNNPVETLAQKWDLGTDDEGKAGIQIKASIPGQYRLSYRVTDAKEHSVEGGYLFCVRGQGSDGKEFRFNEIELIPDKREYAPGDKVRLMINADYPGATVVLFIRPANGIYLKPKIIRMKGKSVIEEIEVTKKDMPNFFVEAFTISDGKLYNETKEIIVPPEKRVLNVEVIPSSESYKPGEEAQVKVKLTDFFGEPFVGSTVVSIYDKSVEYISGGSNVPEIKAFFWKWRRHHNPHTESSLN